jgi:hypothetical protein
MTISINYQKRKNTQLFNKFQTNKSINLTNVQNYIPIYDKFFSLNNTNYNSINLNHYWYISDIKDIKNNDSPNIFNCKLVHDEGDKDDNTKEEQCVKKTFMKLAPLLNYCKYLVGKYDYVESELFNLPSLDKTNSKIHPKILDVNNSSYVDGFFSFLTSKLLHDDNFIHGLDYYGSFLGIKNNFKIDVYDDIDYLIQSDFFNKQKNKLFQIEDYSHLICDNTNVSLPALKISSSKNLSEKSIDIIDDNIFEDIFVSKNDTSINTDMVLNEINKVNEINNIDLLDITDSNTFSQSYEKHNESLKSSSSCSSRTSYTNDDDYISDSNDDDDDNTNGNNNDLDGVNELDDNDNQDNESSDSYETTIEDETLFLTIPQFPVQVICTEFCENTFDNLILNEDLSQDEWFSALMQIIMILITYQKVFSFTHNDLHTNNIMYISTEKKYLYYIYDKVTYRVPTFGKIYKLIDFGRAIYKFNGKIFCSDSFQSGGDAATQYNTEPFFNDKKPRLEPNFSFDLCRLACSIFDYVVDDFEMIKKIDECEPIVKLINEWCIDDNGINVLYKNNGLERYPDFKLYKMIARCVHNHVPLRQLERAEFKKFMISSKNVPANTTIINIDNLPVYC